jgi:hypothetical protein
MLIVDMGKVLKKRKYSVSLRSEGGLLYMKPVVFNSKLQSFNCIVLTVGFTYEEVTVRLYKMEIYKGIVDRSNEVLRTFYSVDQFERWLGV